MTKLKHTAGRHWTAVSGAVSAHALTSFAVSLSTADNHWQLAWAIQIINRAPNLENLEIRNVCASLYMDEVTGSPHIDWSQLPNLRTLSLSSRNLANEVPLMDIVNILAQVPTLETFKCNNIGVYDTFAWISSARSDEDFLDFTREWPPRRALPLLHTLKICSRLLDVLPLHVIFLHLFSMPRLE